jgi:hypothetical protein
MESQNRVEARLELESSGFGAASLARPKSAP